MPSTHVVFDSLKKSKKLIPENYKKTPLLPILQVNQKMKMIYQSNKNTNFKTGSYMVTQMIQQELKLFRIFFQRWLQKIKLLSCLEVVFS